MDSTNGYTIAPVGASHVCSKPACLPAPPDLDKGSPSLNLKSKLVCSLLLKGLQVLLALWTPELPAPVAWPLPHPCPLPLPGLYAVVRYFLIAWHLLACSRVAGVKVLVPCHFRFCSLPSFPNKMAAYFSFQLPLF